MIKNNLSLSVSDGYLRRRISKIVKGKNLKSLQLNLSFFRKKIFLSLKILAIIFFKSSLIFKDIDISLLKTVATSDNAPLLHVATDSFITC